MTTLLSITIACETRNILYTPAIKFSKAFFAKKKPLVIPLLICLLIQSAYGQSEIPSAFKWQEQPNKVWGSSDITTCSTPGTNTLIPDQVSTVPLHHQASHFLTTLFDTGSFPARWHCGDWSPFHGWLYILSDIMTWIAYFTIPGILFFFIYKREQSITYHRIVVFFILFILFCGVTHFLDALIFWVPVYKLSALVKFSTSVVSVLTVFSLAKVMPIAMRYKSPVETQKIIEELTLSNARLQHEVSLRKEAEEEVTKLNQNLNKKVEELRAFSYSVSHDLRSPLRSVHGFAEALMEDNFDQLDEIGKSHLKRINNGAIRMGQLIDDLLLLSKISKKEVKMEDVDITVLTHEIVTDFEYQHQDTRYQFEIEEGLMAKCDARLIRIALENLITNACKFSAKIEAPKITIGQDKEIIGNPFFVKDNGVGFDMKFSGKLFKAFQRLHSVHEFKGTGIGLAIVSNVIGKHEGRIWGESTLNEGATFYFTLN